MKYKAHILHVLDFIFLYIEVYNYNAICQGPSTVAKYTMNLSMMIFDQNKSVLRQKITLKEYTYLKNSQLLWHINLTKTALQSKASVYGQDKECKKW